MKKFLACWLIISLLFLSSCSIKKNIGVELDYFHATKHTATIVEKDQSIYFAKKDGIYRQDGTQKPQNIAVANYPDRLQLNGGYIYFVAENGTILYRVSERGDEVARLFDITEYDNTRLDIEILDYQIIEEKIYFASGWYFFCYDLEKKEIYDFHITGGIEVFEIKKEKLYYIDHSERTFTIYELDLNSLQKRIIIGNGISEPTNGICFDFLWHMEQLYYLQRRPHGLYCWQENDSTLLVHGTISAFFAKNNQLYYVKDEQLYCGADVIAEVEDITESAGITIVNGIVYYQSKSIPATSILKRVKR